jgi:cytochrome c
MKPILAATLAALALSGPALSGPALAGDAAIGEADYKKCKACHMIVADDGTEIQKGGKTGPNLYGIIGRVAGSVEGFKYKASIVALGETGFVWTEETIAEYVVDPAAFLKDKLGDAGATSGMAKQALKEPQNIAAYLASVAPAAE